MSKLSTGRSWPLRGQRVGVGRVLSKIKLSKFGYFDARGAESEKRERRNDFASVPSAASFDRNPVRERSTDRPNRRALANDEFVNQHGLVITRFLRTAIHKLEFWHVSDTRRFFGNAGVRLPAQDRTAVWTDTMRSWRLWPKLSQLRELIDLILICFWPFTFSILLLVATWPWYRLVVFDKDDGIRIKSGTIVLLTISPYPWLWGPK